MTVKTFKTNSSVSHGQFGNGKMLTLFITGASTGIGRALVEHYVGMGHRVFAGVRKDKDANDIQQACTAYSGQVTACLCDISDQATIEQTRDRILADTDGQLDILINNAGIAIGGALEQQSRSQWQQTMDVNVVGTMAVTQAFIPALRKTRGRIITIGSISGRFAPPGLSAYAASKYALEGFSDALRVELAGQGVNVSIIGPGKIDTPIWEKARQDRDVDSDNTTTDQYQALNHYYDQYAEQEPGTPMPVLIGQADHAVFAPNPRARYLVGRASRIRVLLNILPWRWRDRLVSKAMGIV